MSTFSSIWLVFFVPFWFCYRFRVNRIVKIYGQSLKMHHILIAEHPQTNKYAQKRRKKKHDVFDIFLSCFHSNAGIKMTVKIVLALWFTISKVFFSSLFRWPNNRFWPFPKQIDFAFYFQTRSFTVIKYSLKRRRFFYASIQKMARILWTMEWSGWCVCVFFSLRDLCGTCLQFSCAKYQRLM